MGAHLHGSLMVVSAEVWVPFHSSLFTLLNHRSPPSPVSSIIVLSTHASVSMSLIPSSTNKSLLLMWRGGVTFPHLPITSVETPVRVREITPQHETALAPFIL